MLCFVCITEHTCCVSPCCVLYYRAHGHTVHPLRLDTLLSEPCLTSPIIISVLPSLSSPFSSSLHKHMWDLGNICDKMIAWVPCSAYSGPKQSLADLGMHSASLFQRNGGCNQNGHKPGEIEVKGSQSEGKFHGNIFSQHSEIEKDLSPNKWKGRKIGINYSALIFGWKLLTL